MRYRKFNVRAMIDAAINATVGGARTCVKVLKCTEGQYNKTFILTMDNGDDVVVKIPNPNAGPAFYTTASEVATRDFIRKVIGLPIPRVFSYASDESNPVGAEYIIEEKAQGMPLGSLWYQWSQRSRQSLVSQLVDFETQLTSVTFKRHGCLYYKKDLEDRHLPMCELDAEHVPYKNSASSLNTELVEQFAAGPLTQAALWEGERATMKLDRGPWSDPLAYFMALGTNEILWAETHAKPRINAYRSIYTPEYPAEYVQLLRKYLQLMPRISPGPFPTSTSHPDLHLDNIFVDPSTEKITCVIDWQSASISEPFLHPNPPRMLLPVDSGAPNETVESSSAGCNAKASSPLNIYQNLTKAKDESRWAAMNFKHRATLIQSITTLCSAWDRNDLFSFRHALVDAVAQWEQIAPTKPCPISFTPKDLELHESELELVEGLGTVLRQLQDDDIIPLGGMVLRENYELASHLNNSVRETFVKMAESGHQKALYSQIWPYQDRE